MSILAGFAGTPVVPTLVLPRSRLPLPEPIKMVSALPPPLSALPWRLVANTGWARLEQRFARLLEEADPATTIAYFWPGASRKLVQRAKARGILTVREMINTAQASAKPALDAAYARLGLPPTHTISMAAVEEEIEELALYDLVFASNAPCEVSLIDAGVRADRIFPTSFGWSPPRFELGIGHSTAADRGPGTVKILFAGSISVRKGVPTLLEAWEKLTVDAELTLVGNVEPALEPLVSRAVARGSVRVLPFTRDIGALYRSHDVFVFPTVEEGGPQVTIEAGGCGLPVITTPMGAARLVKDGVNGIIVPAGAVELLSAAIASLASDPGLRQRYSRRIAADAQAFTYDKLGAERALAFIERLEHRHPEVVSYA
ncbi:glycosyltransferase [Devosia sp.]|uniref:glycosyltransferase n=1 Tax=Devosia sp. TaxID=1871048 RepID=UPI00263503D0|nr:glycosyltransferase [Devosia sp.]